MNEFKTKQNIFDILRDAVESGVELGKNAIDNIKDAMETPQVRRMQAMTSFIKLGMLGDVTSINTITKTMFPFESKGIKIDYSRRYYEGCPTHKTPTFGTSDPYYVWCPLCMDFLQINTPFY